MCWENLVLLSSGPTCLWKNKATEKGLCIQSLWKRNIFVKGVFLIYPKCFPKDIHTRKLIVFLKSTTDILHISSWRHGHALIWLHTKVYPSNKNYKIHINIFNVFKSLNPKENTRTWTTLTLWFHRWTEQRLEYLNQERSLNLQCTEVVTVHENPDPTVLNQFHSQTKVPVTSGVKLEPLGIFSWKLAAKNLL